MNVKELRIGNIIGWYEPSMGITPVVVERVCENYIDTNVEGSYQSKHPKYQSFKPFPLTEEWINRSPFLKWKGHNTWSFKSVRIYMKADGKFYYGSVSTRKEIKSVHKLQNLVYELADVELEFTKQD